VTPFTASLQKGKAYFAGQSYVLTFHKDGYYDMQQDLEGTVSSWYFGNLLFGGVVGFLVVDPHTGAMYTFPKKSRPDLPQLRQSHSQRTTKVGRLRGKAEGGKWKAKHGIVPPSPTGYGGQASAPT